MCDFPQASLARDKKETVNASDQILFVQLHPPRVPWSLRCSLVSPIVGNNTVFSVSDCFCKGFPRRVVGPQKLNRSGLSYIRAFPFRAQPPTTKGDKWCGVEPQPPMPSTGIVFLLGEIFSPGGHTSLPLSCLLLFYPLPRPHYIYQLKRPTSKKYFFHR